MEMILQELYRESVIILIKIFRSAFYGLSLNDVRLNAKEFGRNLLHSPAGKGDRGERWLRRAPFAMHKNQKQILFNKIMLISALRKFSFH